MIVNRSKLIDSLIKVKPGLSNSDLIEQSTCFIFRENGKVYSYNEEIFISFDTELKINAVVNGEVLLNFLSKLKEEKLVIENRGSDLVILGKNYKAGIILNKEDVELPISEIGVCDNWNKLPEKFMEIIKTCLFSASGDETNLLLNCIHLTDGHIESCDNFRLTRVYLNSNFGNIILPLKSAKNLVKYEVEEWQSNNNWIHFLLKDGGVFSCRIVDGDYPSLDNLISVNNPIKINFPEDLYNDLDKAEIFSNVDLLGDKLMNVNFEVGKLKIRGENSDGWFEEELSVKYRGKKFSFKVNILFLREILKQLNIAEISEDMNRIKFSNEEFMHVISLISEE